MELDRITLESIERLAAEQIDPRWWRYLSGGAEAGRTLRGNVEALGRFALRPRVLAGLADVSTATTVLGAELASPVVVAPTGYQGMFHPDGEAGLARAAAATGIGYCLSTLSTHTPAEVARAAPGLARFYQVYVFRDRGITETLISEALEAGFTALFLTVDVPVLGPRDGEREVGWVMPPLPSVHRLGIEGAHPDDFMDVALDWSYVEHLVSAFPVPVVVKGVLTSADTVLALEHGAAGVVVSNHGGRQLDGSISTISALPEIVEAAGEALEIFIDGGFRRGSDVVKAIALGARAVLIGRLPLFGLGAGGEAGARRVLELLRDEIAIDLHLLGCPTLADVGREHVVKA